MQRQRRRRPTPKLKYVFPIIKSIALGITDMYIQAAKHAAEEAKGAEEPKGGAASAAHIERTTATKQ
jgi:hypothetical protein